MIPRRLGSQCCHHPPTAGSGPHSQGHGRLQGEGRPGLCSPRCVWRLSLSQAHTQLVQSCMITSLRTHPHTKRMQSDFQRGRLPLIFSDPVSPRPGAGCVRCITVNVSPERKQHHVDWAVLTTGLWHQAPEHLTTTFPNAGTCGSCTVLGFHHGTGEFRSLLASRGRLKLMPTAVFTSCEHGARSPQHGHGHSSRGKRKGLAREARVSSARSDPLRSGH